MAATTIAKSKVMEVGMLRPEQTSEQRPTLLPKPSDSLYSGSKPSLPALKLPDKEASQDDVSAMGADISGLQSPSERFYDPPLSPSDRFYDPPNYFEAPAFFPPPVAADPNMGFVPMFLPMMTNDAVSDTAAVPVTVPNNVVPMPVQSWDSNAAATTMMPNGTVGDAVMPAPGCWDSVATTGDVLAGVGAGKMGRQISPGASSHDGGTTQVPKAVFIDLSLLRDRRPQY